MPRLGGTDTSIQKPKPVPASGLTKWTGGGGKSAPPAHPDRPSNGLPISIGDAMSGAYKGARDMHDAEEKERRDELSRNFTKDGKPIGTLPGGPNSLLGIGNAEDRKTRVDALEMTTGALNTTAPMLKEMSTDDYLKLTGPQRAAIDFNTSLSDAVQADKAHQDDYRKGMTADQSSTYEKSVRKMFGDDRGSDTTAPRTMAVLRQLDLDDKSADLDDFLGMKVAITADDLKYFKDDLPGPRATELLANPIAPSPTQGARDKLDALPDNTQHRVEYLGTIVNSSEQLQKQLAKGNTMLESFNATARADRADDLGNMGVQNKPYRPSAGYGKGDTDLYFQRAFDILSQPKNAKDANEILGVINSERTPEEVAAFFKYADTRATNAQAYGLKLGDTDGVEYTSPEEFRKLLGLDQ